VGKGPIESSSNGWNGSPQTPALTLARDPKGAPTEFSADALRNLTFANKPRSSTSKVGLNQFRWVPRGTPVSKSRRVTQPLRIWLEETFDTSI